MRIVSLNAWGGRRGRALLEWVRRGEAHVYCFQEVFSAPSLEEPRLPDGDGYTIDADLHGSLARALPGYRTLFSAGSRGYVNDSTWTGLPLEYGLALFVHPSISIVAQRATMVHGSFRFDGSGEPPLSRTAQVVRLLTPWGTVTLGHLHGLWQPSGKGDSAIRKNQAERFAELLGSVRASGDALVACGDFNVLPSSVTFEILGRLGLRDLVAAHGIESTRTELYRKEIRYGDYLLVDDRVAVERFEALEQPVVSDHRPLVLSARLRSPLP